MRDEVPDFSGWLLLMHQLPSRPAYLRVKVWRSLREAGAIALRHSGYVLPLNAHAASVMRQAVKEIERGKGQAALCEARFIDGITDNALRDQFNKARDGDYAALERDLRKIGAARSARGRLGETRIKLEKAGQRLRDIAAIDFFGAKNRVRAESLLSRLEHSYIVRAQPADARQGMTAARGKVWVTRQNIHVDRIACAWLIRRFIDPRAQFKFVTDRKYRSTSNELRFDMPDAEFTHEGDDCSFETILKRFSLTDPALRAIADIIHDLDLKDGRHGRAETAEVGRMIDDICLTRHRDTDRMERGRQFLDEVLARFRAAP
jgi:hypothetical protein